MGCVGPIWDLCRVRVGLSLLLAAACPGRRHGSVLLRLRAHCLLERFEGSDVVNLVPCDPALMLCVCPLVCVCMWCGSLDCGRREVLMSCGSKMNVVVLSLVCVLQCARFRMRVLVGGGKARANRRVGRLPTAVGPATS